MSKEGQLTFANFQTATPSLLISVHHSACALFAVDAAQRAQHADIKNSLSTTTRLMHFLHTRDDITLSGQIVKAEGANQPGDETAKGRKSYNSRWQLSAVVSILLNNL